MSFTSDADTKERVRAATDIVELLGGRLELRRQGSNYVALCPWHADTRPSLQINPERQIWKCWVCNIGGDVFDFLMRDEGLTFPEALKKLAEQAGIPLSFSRGNRKSAGPDTKAEMLRALTWVDAFYQRCLLETPAGEQAVKYLHDRGITRESIQTFGLGLSPDSWSAVVDRAPREKLTPHVLESAGLVRRRERGGHYDFFRNRLMFPIRDRQKQVIAFGGRILPGSQEGAKYINSPDSRLFHKSQQLYGFDLASDPIRRSRQAIVMEGYTDVIIAQQSGVENAVAVLGTALGEAHLKLLQRHNCDSVVLVLDGDEAGQRRSDEVLELFLHAQMDVRVLSLPQGMDPADFLLERGSDAFQELIQAAGDALDFKLRRVSSGLNPLVDTHRANSAVEEMLALLAKVPSAALISNESFRLRQNQVLPRLARQFSLPEDTLRERLAALRQKRTRYATQRRAADAPTEGGQNWSLTDLSLFERELIELLIVAPQVAPIALERVQSGWLECEAATAILAAYQQLEFSGESLEFEDVLQALDDSHLESLLVALQIDARAKMQVTRYTAEARLCELTRRLEERQDERRRQHQVTQLQNAELSESEQMDVLQDVIRQARLRQGLAEPPAEDSTAADPSGQVDPSANEPSDPARELPSTEQAPPA